MAGTQTILLPLSPPFFPLSKSLGLDRSQDSNTVMAEGFYNGRNSNYLDSGDFWDVHLNVWTEPLNFGPPESRCNLYISEINWERSLRAALPIVRVQR